MAEIELREVPLFSEMDDSWLPFDVPVEEKQKSALDHDPPAATPPKAVLPATAKNQEKSKRNVQDIQEGIDAQQAFQVPPFPGFSDRNFPRSQARLPLAGNPTAQGSDQRINGAPSHELRAHPLPETVTQAA